MIIIPIRAKVLEKQDAAEGGCHMSEPSRKQYDAKYSIAHKLRELREELKYEKERR